MSKKNDQSDLGISLRDIASIWDSGKKFTRGAKQQLKLSACEKELAEKQSEVSFDSKKSIETKKDLKKVDKNAKKKQGAVKGQRFSISEYVGVPDLESYITSQDLLPKSHYSLEKYSIGQLGKTHLPSLIRVILKTNLTKSHYQIKRGELKKQKTTRQQFLIDLSTSSSSRSDVRSINKDNGIVLVGENLAMMRVGFEEWREWFGEEIAQIYKETVGEDEADDGRIDQQKEEENRQEDHQNRDQERIFSENDEDLQGDKRADQQLKQQPQSAGISSMNDQHANNQQSVRPMINQSNPRIEQQKSLQFVQILPNQSSQLLSSQNDQNDHQKQPQPQPRRQDNSSHNPDWNQQKPNEQEKNKQSLDERQLFNRFCIPGCEFILWPVMLYQTVLGNHNQAIQIIQNKQYQFSDKDKLHQHIFQTLSKSTQGLFQTYLTTNNTKSYPTNSLSPQQDPQTLQTFNTFFYSSVLPQLTTSPILSQQQQQVHSPQSQLNLIVYPFGSGKLITLPYLHSHNTNLIPWNRFPRGFMNFYFSHSAFRQSLQEICQAIERLNEFARCQVSECKIEEIRNSIDRLVKCRVDNKVCNGITLRYSNIQKKLLVLVFGSSLTTSNQLIWVNPQQIFPNYTLPQLNPKNKFLLYFSNAPHPQWSLTSFLQDIYCHYFYQPIPHILFANHYYHPPQSQPIYSSTLSILNRCVECVYPIHKLQYFKCCFCQKYCHKECSNKLINKSVELNFQAVDNLWTCNSCEPCTLCLQPLSNKRISCIKCFNMFHQICGKLKIQQNTLHRDRYLCENCIQCKICQKKLKNQDYNILKDGSYQCNKCLSAEQKNQICHICKKQGDGKWAQCQRQFCGKWIHKNCDKYTQSRSILFTNNQQPYYCPFCRRVQKRRIILKFIQTLTVFDQYQYFIGSDYEDLLDYKYVILTPMCFKKMYQRCHEGAYDENTKENLTRDFDLLISNALKYNMPKDQPHYQARILNILGQHAISKFHSILECSQEDIIKGGLLTVLQEKRRQLHKEIYDRYLQIILNYRSVHSTVQVKKPKEALSKAQKLSHYHPNESQHFAFSSRHLLKQVFKSSMLKFKTSKHPPTISNLFQIQKVIESYKCPIKQSFCYYHYWNSNVIYYCPQCMEHYCCTTNCYKHHVCTTCGIKGCACDMNKCGCPPLKQKERKMYEKIIHQRYYDRREITENFSLCLRCACEKLSTKVCCYCQKAYEFYYDLETCSHCGKIYHKECGDVHASQTMAKFFFKKQKQFPNQQLFSSNHRLQKSCYQCSITAPNRNKLFQKLKSESLAKLKKLQKLGKFQPLISSIYQQNGIKINLNDILMLILNNYEEFLQYECLFEEYKMNFPSVRLNTKLGQRAQERLEMMIREDVWRKVYEVKIQVQTKVQIMTKSLFSGLVLGSPQEWRSRVEFAQVWNDKIVFRFKEFILKNLTLTGPKQRQHMRKLKLQYLLDKHQRTRTIQRTQKLQQQTQKLNVINVITLPTSKKNIPPQSSQKLPLWSKTHIQPPTQPKSTGSKTLILIQNQALSQEFLSVLFDQHCFKTFTEIEIEGFEIVRREQQRKKQWGYDKRVCLLALRGDEAAGIRVFGVVSPVVYERGETAVYEFVLSKPFLVKQYPLEDLNSIQLQPSQQLSTIKTPQMFPNSIDLQSQLQLPMSSLPSRHLPLTPSIPTLQQKLMKIHLNHTNLSKISKYKRLFTLHTVITKFLLRCFQMNKSVYRRGNTCVLKAESNHWRVLKKGKAKGDLYEITLKKDMNKWFFSINESTWWIESIDQIISKLKPLVDIFSFRELADFLGFTFKFIPVQKATHFTRFLQTNPLQDMSPHSKKRMILELYDKLDWLRSGSFKLKMTQPGKQQVKQYVNTKRKIFYLEKKKSKLNQSDRQSKLASQPPYITFEDLKKDLDDTVQTKKQQTIILTSPGDTVFIGPSPIHKLGLFAKYHCPKHTTMVQYIGQVLSESTADIRESRFHYGCYMFGLNRRNCDKREIIDATFKGNMARYLNHSCDPNCKAKIEIVDGQPSIFIYSIREIGQFQELTYDYQFSVDGEEKLVCTCGAKNCQGRLN